MILLRVTTISILVAGAALAGFALVSRGKRRKADPELDRRTWLSRSGRLTIGTALDVQDSRDQNDHLVQLLIYRYDIAGVAYDASQDVTHLRQFIDVNSCRRGLPVTVKYDTHNPGNSIVISETWNGLRK